MLKSNIIKKLEKEGYTIESGKFDYWQVTKIIIDEKNYLLLADGVYSNGSYGVIEDFKYSDVIDAIETIKRVNKYFKGMINNSLDKITSMGEYFLYKEGKFPYEYDIVNKILDE